MALQYNSEANSQDIVSEILAICGNITVTDYPLVEITRRFNFALDRYFFLAFESDGKWNFDDINETSPPIDTQDLVSGTNRYKMSAFTEKVLSLIKLELLDEDDNGISLKPILFKDLEGSFEDLYINAESGTPTSYIKYGDFIYLDRKPDYNKTSGLKAYFNRPASYMEHDDTTKVPGTPGVHHEYLCRMASLPWLVERKVPQMQGIAQLIQTDEDEIRKYFSRRTKDMKKKMTIAYQNNR